jgi:ketosteroid isomerase-like protein
MTRSASAAAARPHPGSPRVRFAVRDRYAAESRAQKRPGLKPTIARWSLEMEGGFESASIADPATALVRCSLADYRAGRADRASRVWHDDIRWDVPGEPPVGGPRTGPEAVFAYHALLGQLTDGTFRQRLVALEGCHGSIVNAYLRTTATRNGRSLDIPTLAVFELAGGCVRQVTELPGDLEAWHRFWAA